MSKRFALPVFVAVALARDAGYAALASSAEAIGHFPMVGPIPANNRSPMDA